MLTLHLSPALSKFLLFALILAGFLLMAASQGERLLKSLLIGQLETALNAEVRIAAALLFDVGTVSSLNLRQLEVHFPARHVKLDSDANGNT